jgi:hypothetical protein
MLPRAEAKPGDLDAPLLSRACVVLVTILAVEGALLYSRLHPAGQYEVSIYSHAAPSFIALGALSVVAIGGTTAAALYQKSQWVPVGLLCFFVISVGIALVPSSRGYELPNAFDEATHVGLSKDILQNHRLAIVDFYPATHLLVASLVAVAHIPLADSVPLTGKIFFSIMVGGTYVLVRRLAGELPAVFATMAAGSMVFFYTDLFPDGYAACLFPAFFFTIVRFSQDRTLPWALLSILLVLFLPALHPLGALACMAGIVCIEISRLARLRRLGPHGLSTLPILVLVVLGAWLTQYAIFWQNFSRSFSKFLNLESTATPFTQTAATGAARLGLSTKALLIAGLASFGEVIVLFGMTVGAFAFSLWFLLRRRAPLGQTYNWLGLFAVLVFGAWLVDYIVPLTGLRSGRLLWFALPMMFPFCGLFLARVGKTSIRGSRLVTAGAVVLLLSLAVAGGEVSYQPSPLTEAPGADMSKSVAEASVWFGAHADRTLPLISATNAPPFRYMDYTMGVDEASKYYPVDDLAFVQDHFGYQTHENAGAEKSRPTYVIAELGSLVKIYTGVYKAIGRFNSSDTSRLQSDPTTNLVYTDGQASVYVITPQPP